MTSPMLSANLDGTQIAYVDFKPAGEVLKTVLLIHGFASTAQVNWINTEWTKVLTEAGYRVVALDNRGHGESQKFYRSQDYGPDLFSGDAIRLLDYLEIDVVDVIGYSMGARITAWLAHENPQRVAKAVLGGMGSYIFGGRRDYEGVAHALEVDDVSTIEDRDALAFRLFADRTGSDRLALAACIRPSKHQITQSLVESIQAPVLVVVGSDDEIAGSGEDLAAMMPNGEAVTLAGLDHMRTTGAKEFKNAALEFLARD